MSFPDSANGWIMLVLVGWLVVRLVLAVVLTVREAKSLGRKHPYALLVWVHLVSGIAFALFGAVGWRMLTEGKLAPMFGCFSIFVGLLGFVVGLVFDFFLTAYVQRRIAILFVARHSSVNADRLVTGEPQQKLEAARAFVYMGQRASFAVPEMLAALTDSDAELRCQIAWALLGVESADPGIDTAMRKALNDADPRVRAMSACVLVKRGNADAEQQLPHLRAGLRLEQIHGITAEALGILGPAAAPAVPDLMLRFNDEDGVTYPVRMALEKIGRAAVPALIETLKSANPKVRIAAIEALEDMGGAANSALQSLREMYVGADQATKRAIASAVKEIGRKRK